MLIFQWNKHLETGVALLDEQHKQIIEHVNQFFIRHKCGKNRTAADECLQFLQQYILYHFQAEEAFQVDCAYPGYRPHQALHHAMSMQIKAFTVRLQAQDYAEPIMDEFHAFLSEWVTNHILTQDMDFAIYYRDHHA